jgi:ATP-binding cassette subfamily F protein uup
LLLTAQSISKSHGLRTLFTGVTLSIAEGERIGLIGPNGAGKSTLLKLLAGVDGSMGEHKLDGGTITAAKGLKAVYVPQVDEFGDDPAITAREVVTEAAMRGGISAGVHDHHEAEMVGEMILSRIGFDEGHSSASAATLSGGWRKRLSIARALASVGGEPDLLMLDEPTNHLDLDGIDWLEELLLRPMPGGRGTFASVFVTHDRVFLENVATRVVELSRAYPEGTLSVKGNYTEFLRRKEEFLSGQARAQQAVANQVKKDLDWLSRKPEARRTKSKSKIAASYERQDELAELKTRNAAAGAAGARVDFTGTGRRTNRFILATGLAKAVGEPARTLFKDVDIDLGAGDCLGLLGPNGSGKTTLIRVLTGELRPDAGTIKVCDPPPRVVVFSQHRREFDPATPLQEALCPVSDRVVFQGQAMHITGWSRRFLFRDEQLLQPVGSLSGGELARVHIARIMLEPADVLVLDEPTNDLDIPTLQVLEEALEDFPGALVLVTHDRAMLGRLATEVLWLDGKGGSRMFAHLDQALAAQAELERLERREIAERAGKEKATGGTPVPPPQSKKKLSYNEQREFDSMEKRIHEAEAASASAEERVNDPAVMADHVKMGDACAKLQAAQEAVAALYARWEELEAKLR